MIRHLSDEMAGPSCVFSYVLSVDVEYVRNQYSETNVMHFLFSLLRINGLYMFRALLAHLQEALHKRHLNKRHLVYWVRVVSWLLPFEHICWTISGQWNWVHTSSKPWILRHIFYEYCSPRWKEPYCLVSQHSTSYNCPFVVREYI
jgi:hypothetical protein